MCIQSTGADDVHCHLIGIKFAGSCWNKRIATLYFRCSKFSLLTVLKVADGKCKYDDKKRKRKKKKRCACYVHDRFLRVCAYVHRTTEAFRSVGRTVGLRPALLTHAPTVLVYCTCSRIIELRTAAVEAATATVQQAGLCV